MKAQTKVFFCFLLVVVIPLEVDINEIKTGNIRMVYDVADHIDDFSAMKTRPPLRDEAYTEWERSKNKTFDSYAKEFQTFPMKKLADVETFRANINITREIEEADSVKWRGDQNLRICLQYYEHDKNDREMIRFINNGPLGKDNDRQGFADVENIDFKVQFAKSIDMDEAERGDLKAFCSKPIDWDGLIQTEQDQPATECYEGDTRYCRAEVKSGVYLASQWIFVEIKDDGLYKFENQTTYWQKESAHVVFRRALNPISKDAMRMHVDNDYHFILQWGLWDDVNDSDPQKVQGGVDWDNTAHIHDFQMPKVSSSQAAKLVSGLLTAVLVSWF